MSLADILILAVILGLAALVVVMAVRRSKKGGSASCAGCAHADTCGHVGNCPDEEARHGE